MPELPGYTEACQVSWEAGEVCLQKICNKYLWCILWYLEDHEEPLRPYPPYDPLKCVDNNDGLTEQEIKKKRERIDFLTEVHSHQKLLYN